MRLNIEDRFFSERHRYLKLSKIMGWTEWEAIGHLVMLWHGSQGAEQIRATGEEICDWSEVYDNESTYLNALCHKTVRYCDLLQDGNFLIRGSKKHVESLRRFRERSQKAHDGKLLKKQKRLASSKQQADFKLPTSAPQACPITITNTITNKDKSLSLIGGNSESPEPVECQDNKDTSSNPEKVNNVKTSKSNSKPKIKTWREDHPYSRAFEYLTRLKPYKSIFDLPYDENKIREWLHVHQIDLARFEKECLKFADWYHEKPMKSPRGALSGWLGRMEDRQGKNGSGKKPDIVSSSTPKEEDPYAPF